jgi:hypothetical protein
MLTVLDAGAFATDEEGVGPAPICALVERLEVPQLSSTSLCELEIADDPPGAADDEETGEHEATVNRS